MNDLIRILTLFSGSFYVELVLVNCEFIGSYPLKLYIFCKNIYSAANVLFVSFDRLEMTPTIFRYPLIQNMTELKTLITGSINFCGYLYRVTFQALALNKRSLNYHHQ